ncbi:nitroreductase/quinone reductase family protein [Novosphingobium album (ex Hu et al. 2023)]|uniref:Nitroreductase family deazaflavin-dependent oxidoreductase n=1 Tax=Novosphingobium album (ex Hu et al. 2023) TaxID=2930093 RepID=A0ABT0AXG5_9SPHN|nr:nitroreductase/quinone reductase family protein [Novosphingobium album (ex Hu et al. 2023)]MCJ2177330.1 nitroreductase family deazaflavin-dependent oxidoreductase [Novosphingobium album (ex Hu et al. 2023)]
MTFEGTEQLLARTQDFVNEHRSLYLQSGGAMGHILDFKHAGARGLLPSLLLKTIGRKSGRIFVTPLIYGIYGDEWVVIASKGGAPEHPAWYLNLTAQPSAGMQVATQAFEVQWREPVGEERDAVWAYMAHLYPPYGDYQKASEGRVIPVVMLSPKAELAPFSAELI